MKSFSELARAITADVLHAPTDDYKTAIGMIVLRLYKIALDRVPGGVDKSGEPIGVPPSTQLAALKEILDRTEGKAGVVKTPLASEDLSWQDFIKDFPYHVLSTHKEPPVGMTEMDFWREILERVAGVYDDVE